MANSLLSSALSRRGSSPDRSSRGREIRRANTDDPLQRTIVEWQPKYHIADYDPMIAILELVRVFLEHSRARAPRDDASIPTFEDFRGTISTMARHFGREDAALHWQPKQTYNLTSDRSIPYNTFAKAVVDTAGSLGQSGDKGFFKNQAQIHIAAALETLREIGADDTGERLSSAARSGRPG